MATAASTPALEQTLSTPDLGRDELILETRERVRRRAAARDRLASFLLGGAFLAAGLAAATLLPVHRHPSPLTTALYVLAYALVSRVEFEIGTGAAIPTQLVLVPMLFVLPLRLVPLCVAAALVLRSPEQLVRRRLRPEGVAVLLLSSWHALGPALVLLAAGGRAPAWSNWPIYLGALGAQFAFDFASSSAREWLAFGSSPWSRIRFMGWVWAVDAALAPVGLLIAFAATARPWALAAVFPLVGLLGLFARERRVRIDYALELSNAYRGTALLLGDVVEADDSYTGSHSRDVVSLTVEVAERLGLDSRARRDAEFVALLHDVGKIRIPQEIINKPGPLTAEERALVETHTVEGQQMLERVGGLIGEVGRIVRSCHERYDGHGYPDGLAEDDIPLIARIVCCCDAFSAMTTDRPYRRALSLEVAVEELRQNAGAQFDPDVVAALVATVEAGS